MVGSRRCARTQHQAAAAAAGVRGDEGRENEEAGGGHGGEAALAAADQAPQLSNGLSELAADPPNCSCCTWLPLDEATACVLDWMDKQESKPSRKRLGVYALIGNQEKEKVRVCGGQSYSLIKG